MKVSFSSKIESVHLFNGYWEFKHLSIDTDNTNQTQTLCPYQLSLLLPYSVFYNISKK